MSLGLRDEFSTGWNEAHGRAANYTFNNGVISSQPQNRRLALHHQQCEVPAATARGPRVESVQFEELFSAQALECTTIFRMRSDIAPIRTRPFNPTYSIASLPVSQLPIDPTAPVPAKALLVAGGVQPDMKTPTLISWSLRVQQEISPNTSLTVGYVGSHGYHEIIGVRRQRTVFRRSVRRRRVPPIIPALFPERWRMLRFQPEATTFPRERPKPIQPLPIPGRGFRAATAITTRCRWM